MTQSTQFGDTACSTRAAFDCDCPTKVDTRNELADNESISIFFFKIARCLPVERLVNSLRVVDGFDVLEDAASGLIDIGKVSEVRPLMLD
jgi:hypothetical protein